MNLHLISIFSFGILTFLVAFLATPFYIKMLKDAKLGKQIRENALTGKATEFFKLHKNKAGTPTMGAGVLLGAVFFMVILSMILQGFGIINNSLFSRNETYLTLFTLGTIGLLGAIDDFMNIKGIGRTKGLSGKFKMIWLTLFATMGAFWFYYKLGWNIDHMLNTPFLALDIGLSFIPLFILIIVGFSNSVNITDGLDGLAGGLLLFAYAVYGYITFDQEMFLLSTLCFSIVGALIAFLWFNVKPAKFYMGDMGSLALGANLGIIAMLTNTIFVLFIVGAIFIFETLSVIIQLTSKKLRKGKKKFLKLHHFIIILKLLAGKKKQLFLDYGYYD
ncbi:MAG: phospho-N-acetylmuramoyl-pentapeptide-transferase [Candidatus Gracilibacteria bacterium]|nr:phospho-N-acetylmuramoyl-pentapeptide-transferase [Candidatus Gracilibacteria bacterium]